MERWIGYPNYPSILLCKTCENKVKDGIFPSKFWFPSCCTYLIERTQFKGWLRSLHDTTSMDNNNSIPYGSISWDNEDSFAPTNQPREPRGIPPLRPTALPSSNGLRYSLRGPHFPPPQQRNQAVGISRNLELANRFQQGETPQSSFQQPSSSSASSAPYERYFTLRPSRSTSHVQMHSMEPQSSKCVNSTTEGQSYATLYANPSPGSSSGNPTLNSVSEHTNFSTPGVYNENACNNNIEMSQGLLREGWVNSWCCDFFGSLLIKPLGAVVERVLVGKAIHWKNPYPVHNFVCWKQIRLSIVLYSLDSELFGG